MGAQNILQAGLDITSLSSVTQAQLMQMVEQAVFLNNIGGLVVMSGAGSAHPDVTNNPYMIRFGWIDTQTVGSPILKLYTGVYPSDTYADWSALPVADGSITAAKLADYSVSIRNASNNPKIVYNQDGTGDATKAGFVLQLDTSGQYVGVISFASLLATQNIDPAKITPGSSNQVLAVSPTSGLPAWTTLSALITIAVNSLALNTLQYGTAGTAGFILRYKTSGTYEVEAVSNDDSVSSLFPVHTIALTKLAVTGATAGDRLRYDGTNWAKDTPFFGSLGTLPAADGSISIAHGLGATPRVLIGYIKNISGGALNGYNANDLIGINAVSINSTEFTSFGISADSTTVYASVDVGGTGVGYKIRPKGGGPFAAIADVTNWQVWIYASL